MATQTPTSTSTSTTASPGTPEPAPPWTVNLDIAAVVGALSWPIAVGIILVAFRKVIADLSKTLARNITKLELAGISLELATAKGFAPEWSSVAGALDLSHKASAMQVQDSTARTFLEELNQAGTADYAVVNLGTGNQWLSSRLYILAIVFARMKGLKAIVFLETVDNVRWRYIGWAESEKVRWALAKRYPWLEEAYAEAYSNIISHTFYLQARVTNANGGLGNSSFANTPQPGIELIKEFLERIQTPPKPIPTPDELEVGWVQVDTHSNTYEHASWISNIKLQEFLGKDLHTAWISTTDLWAKTKIEQLQLLLSVPEHYVALIKEDHRFDELIDRSIILDKVAQEISSST